MTPTGFCYAVLKLYPPWPPMKEMPLLHLDHDAATIDVLIDARGFQILTISRKAGGSSEHIFQRVELTDTCLVVLLVQWAENFVALRLGGHDLILDLQRTAPVVHLRPKEGTNSLPHILLYPDVDPTRARNDNDRFFLETVRDLDRKVLDGSRYELIRAAGLVRQLLMDGLIDLVNRGYRRQVTFEIVNPKLRLPVPASTVALWQNIDPVPDAYANAVRVRLKELLKTWVLKYAGQDLTVYNVVNACANTKGGVHRGQPNSAEQAAVVALDEILNAAGVEPSLFALSGICKVVLRGLGPLVAAINAATLYTRE
jgi:hypothetical protein